MSRFQSIESMHLAIGLAIYEYQFVEEAILRVLHALYEDSKALEVAFLHLRADDRLRWIASSNRNCHPLIDGDGSSFGMLSTHALEIGMPSCITP